MKFNSNEVESNYRNNLNKDDKIAEIDIHTIHRLEKESRIVIQNNQKIAELTNFQPPPGLNTIKAHG
jgi:hypothetical protein